MHTNHFQLLKAAKAGNLSDISINLVPESTEYDISCAIIQATYGPHIQVIQFLLQHSPTRLSELKIVFNMALANQSRQLINLVMTEAAKYGYTTDMYNHIKEMRNGCPQYIGLFNIISMP